MTTTRRAALTLVLVLAAGCGGDPAPPQPSVRTCAAVRTIVALENAPAGAGGPYPFRWRDALRTLAAGGDEVVRERLVGAERAVQLLRQEGAKDLGTRGDSWQTGVELDGAQLAALVSHWSGVRPDEAVLPAPVAAGCPGVEQLRRPAAATGLDTSRWSRRARLPGLAAATRAAVEQDAPLSGRKARFVRRCEQWYDQRLGSPLGIGAAMETSVNVEVGPFHTGYGCAYDDGDRFAGIATVSRPVALVGDLGGPRPTAVDTPLGHGYLLRGVRLDRAPPSNAWLLVDAAEPAALLVWASKDQPLSVLEDMTRFLAPSVRAG